MPSLVSMASPSAYEPYALQDTWEFAKVSKAPRGTSYQWSEEHEMIMPVVGEIMRIQSKGSVT